MSSHLRTVPLLVPARSYQGAGCAGAARSSGRKVTERDLLKPLGDPKQTPDFYELVALQLGRLAADGDANPSATMAELSGGALSTAQGWVAKARARGLLPPGRRGRAG